MAGFDHRRRGRLVLGHAASCPPLAGRSLGGRLRLAENGGAPERAPARAARDRRRRHPPRPCRHAGCDPPAAPSWLARLVPAVREGDPAALRALRPRDPQHPRLRVLRTARLARLRSGPRRRSARGHHVGARLRFVRGARRRHRQHDRRGGRPAASGSRDRAAPRRRALLAPVHRGCRDTRRRRERVRPGHGRLVPDRGRLRAAAADQAPDPRLRPHRFARGARRVVPGEVPRLERLRRRRLLAVLAR